MQTITVYTDGASRGNPGAAAIAFVIEGLQELPVELYRAIGTTTNNQAEYQAMRAALEHLVGTAMSNASVICYSDSELMVKQIRGEYRVKDELLKPHYQAIIGFCKELHSRGVTLEFVAVRRERNKRADYLANCALDNKIA